jgi:putative flippase GtrA
VKVVVKQITKFFIIGVTAVLVDLVIYYFATTLLDYLNVLAPAYVINISKSFGFLFGSMYTYYLNKRWTWRNNDRANNVLRGKFALIYTISFAFNVGINHYTLAYLPDTFFSINFFTQASQPSTLLTFQGDKIIAFFTATLFSAVFNFVGQKFWVFKQNPELEAEDTSIEVV